MLHTEEKEDNGKSHAITAGLGIAGVVTSTILSFGIVIGGMVFCFGKKCLHKVGSLFQ